MNKQIEKMVSKKTGKVSAPNPEVPATKTRRKFTAKYKLRVLEQADACNRSGELGEFLRREGLYSSNLTIWKKQRKEGILQGMELESGDMSVPRMNIVRCSMLHKR